MEQSEILKRVEEYKNKGYDPTISTSSCIGTGGFTCDVCEEHNDGWSIGVSNKKGNTLNYVCSECFKLFFPLYKVKKILITAGGTKEYIDGVRVLTNISSGKLAYQIYRKFDDCNNDLSRRRINPVPLFEIYYVYVKGSFGAEKEKPFSWNNKHAHLYEVTDVNSVYDVMEKLVPDMDVVIHPMAVSDFGFKPIHTKLKSNDPEAFIESLKKRIYQTPKILSHIKKWNPNCFLISFKFENGLNNEDLINTAFESLYKNDCDLVIANDKDEIKRVGDHISYFIHKKDNIGDNIIYKDIMFKVVTGKDYISQEIFETVNNI